MLTDPRTLKKLLRIEKRYLALRFEMIATLPAELALTREHFRSEPTRSSGLTWRKVEPPCAWGDSGVTGWFRARFCARRKLAGRKLFLRARTGGVEAMLLVDGEHRGVFDGNHPVVLMAARAKAGKTYRVALEAYCGHNRPGCNPDDADVVVPPGSRRFEGLDVVVEREDVSAFVFDLMVLRQLQEALDEHSLRKGKLAAGLARVFDAIDADPACAPESSWRGKLARARKILKPLLACVNGTTAPQIDLIGHSHLDTAWLWPLAETWRKAARTFSSMANLMEQYPEVTFIQPAPCHADVVRREYPGIFRRMRKLARAGRWEPNGAMWVEPDCNLPSGESFVRQLLVGQRATRAMFGSQGDTLWLPDVFGYSAALPQILQGCGVAFFCTTKIAWNDTTRFPYDTFRWRGIDGTEVIAHYNATHCWPDPSTLIGQWQWVQHKDVQDRRLCSYGYGDGGGGPQAEMMEVARRVADLEGCPRTRYSTVSRFMQGVRDELTDLPVWSGELYLEFHRGTLTSIAKIKRGNRKAEIALREAELLATMAHLGGAKYPAGRLLGIWKEVLTNQFHDILPGSSIAEVNEEAVASYEACIQRTREISLAAAKRLFGRPAGKPSHYMAVNTLSWDYARPVAVGGTARNLRPVDDALPSQGIEDVRGRYALLVGGVTVPALGSAKVALKRGRPGGESAFAMKGSRLTTPHAKVRFDKAGRIVSLVVRAAGRELVPAGRALNTLLFGEDVPLQYDNWDIDGDQERKLSPVTNLVSREVVADGPLQLRIRIEYRFGSGSALVQDMVFHADDPRIDFETVVQWSEPHRLLKAAFPLAVLAESARHEIQYGHVDRPTHRNYVADRARFEVCCHKWADLSDNAFGAALLNDCKYGLGVHGSELRLTLLKGGTHPDAGADEGTHEMTYSLRPHAGGFDVPGVVRPAYELNMPPLVVPCAADAQPAEGLLTVDAENVIVESVKWAEEGTALIVRLYEAGKSAVEATVGLNLPVRQVAETNMLEEDPQPRRVRGGRVRLSFRAFEIKTLRCEL